MERKASSGIMLTLLLIGMLTLAFTLQPVKAEPTTWTVDDDGPADFHTIQEAINAANPGDIIYVKAGTYHENVVVNKNNLTILGEDPTTTVIDGGGTGNVAEVNAKNSDINGFTIQNGGQDWPNSGIFLSNSNNNTIKGNNIIHNQYYGIRLYISDSNIITENNITENKYGISLYRSSNNVIEDNNVTTNNNVAIALEGGGESNNNIIQDNTIIGYPYWVPSTIGIRISGWSKGNFLKRNLIMGFQDGIQLEYSSGTVIQRNNITSNRFYGIYLRETYRNIVETNNITNNDWGIDLDESNGNTIKGNTITRSWYYGIRLGPNQVNTNIIRGNTIADTEYYAICNSANNNSIYHNNFINSKKKHALNYVGKTNTWDDGYPSGGNYWSDYTERYPDAEELDGSGIWDTPYVIDADNRDNYPLVEPWTPLPTTIRELKTKIEELGSVGEIDNQGIVQSLLAKLNTAQKLIDKGKIDDAKSILADDFIPQVQNLSGIHITPEAADILIESAEYMIAHL